MVCYNGSNYDYHFLTKKLSEQFKGKFNYLGENSEKYIAFSVPIEKEVTRIDKYGEKVTRVISYRLQFINSARFGNLIIKSCR